jgi:hypothetical protein
LFTNQTLDFWDLSTQTISLVVAYTESRVMGVVGPEAVPVSFSSLALANAVVSPTTLTSY